MSLGSIYGYGAYGSGSGQVMNDLASQLAAQNEQGTSSRASGLGGYGSMSAIRDQVQELLALVPRTGSKLTFSDLFAYRDKLTDELTAEVEADLETLGVDMSKDLVLGLGRTGQVVAQAGHPDKALVDKYFAANPELSDRYAEALKMNSLAKLAENKASPSVLRAVLQQSSMQAWFMDQGANSLLGGSLATGFGSWDTVSGFGGISALV